MWKNYMQEIQKKKKKNSKCMCIIPYYSSVKKNSKLAGKYDLILFLMCLCE
jgi:hypothetical protein